MIPLVFVLLFSPLTLTLPTDPIPSDSNPSSDLIIPTPEYPLPWGRTKPNSNPNTHSTSSDSSPNMNKKSDVWTDDPTLAAPSPQYPLPFSASLPTNNTFAEIMSANKVRVGCTNNPVDSNELENSLTCLSNWCNGGNAIPPHGGEHCTVGGSMMYICSYGGTNPCSANEMVTAWGSIQRDCGPGRGGWWFSSDWKKTYGVDSAGANFFAKDIIMGFSPRRVRRGPGISSQQKSQKQKKSKKTRRPAPDSNRDLDVQQAPEYMSAVTSGCRSTTTGNSATRRSIPLGHLTLLADNLTRESSLYRTVERWLLLGKERDQSRAAGAS
ncbi:hypothetical protein B0T21DRAFT_353740 [Apiosordaria backusii]|uniref:Uncharacterized protein n=1 Tax=Apiosordaria backusii TaxID=314023 RepID=A0AA39ZPL1_9PEZI|nr:hypothetical protein B0T21DRAFT_353740 [Apiosordaria backusii]